MSTYKNQHVSGTIGGSTYGVAKKANLIAVKVLDDSGSGYNSWTLSGLQWGKHRRIPVCHSLGLTACCSRQRCTLKE